MKWTVGVTDKAAKAIYRLPESVRARLVALVLDIEAGGPVRGNWPNYGRLGVNLHHCHKKKGRPTYVAIWESVDNAARLIEVKYVGTHEKAPY